MRVIDWNIKCNSEIEQIMALLEEKVAKEKCIVNLQEVTPDAAEQLRMRFADDFSIAYSLELRKMGKYDRPNRSLGVMTLVSKDMVIKDVQVIDRSIFPERTLAVTIGYGDKELRNVNLHSVTGVSFKIGKAVQFRTFAEFMDEYQPDIVTFDANEPQDDHYIVSEMEFFDQGPGEKGRGARVFFEGLCANDLKDVYVDCYDTSNFVKGKPLVVSFVVLPSYTKKRYDYIFARQHYQVKSVDYLYEEAVAATGDHALILAEMDVD